MIQPLCYTRGHLDRASVQRKDPEWTRIRLQHPDSVFIPLWRNRNLINIDQRSGDRSAGFCALDSDSELISRASHSILLGTHQQRAFFAIDISAIEEHVAVDLCDRGEFIDLRMVGPIMPQHEATLMAYARGMVFWHQNHLFCGTCGRPTVSHDSGHVRRCSSESCARPVFPRINPAVIMLVERPADDNHPARCLLGRHNGLPEGMYSTLAGFVEPAESLEEAVAREVKEETGIRVTDVVYQQSQPWPFPASIMLGFQACALDHEIRIDPDELEDAKWFSAEQVRGFGEWGEDGCANKVPRKDSIARFLVDNWVNNTLGSN